jgi:CRP-like cAMP-binding protein
MELISRILDGSIPYTLKGLPQGRSFFGGRVSQDDKIDRLEEVPLLEACSRKRSRVGPGDYFGEMSLLDGGPRSATVVADTPLRLLVIKRRNFATLLREAPELTQSILATLSRRLRQAEEALG